jgi:enoyl-CoA hydratase/carnithine racemase
MTSNFKTIIYEKQDKIAWVTLNRPEKLNATTLEMLSELKEVFRIINDDIEIHCIILTGAGDKAFCIGSDVNLLSNSFESRNYKVFKDYLKQINDVFFSIEKTGVPVIAMVQGKARAGGFEMLLACDFVFIANEVEIGDVHTPYGHITGGVCQRLTRKIGSQKAMDLIMSGKWITGKEACEEYGIALHSVPANELRDFTIDYAQNHFCNIHRECLSYIKRNILGGADLPLERAVEFETKNYIEYLATSTHPSEVYFKNQKLRLERKKSKQ